MLTQTLPADVTFSSASPGSCTHAAGTVTCPLGTIASGDDAVVTVHVVANAAATLSTSASVFATTDDPTPAGNDATAQTAAQLPVRATPTLTGQTPATATLGAAIADTATLAGGDSPDRHDHLRPLRPGRRGVREPDRALDRAGDAATARTPRRRT